MRGARGFVHRIIVREKILPQSRGKDSTLGDGVRMHKGSVLATFACAGLILSIGVWMMLSPLLTRSAWAVLRSPASGARIVCGASFAPGFGSHRTPEWARAICAMSCEAKGYQVESGPLDIIDFISPEAMRRAQENYRSFIPSPCRA